MTTTVQSKVQESARKVAGEVRATEGEFVAFVAEYPTSPGQMVIQREGKGVYDDLTIDDFERLLLFARRVALDLKQALNVERVALASDGSCINLIPLHGLNADWKPILHAETDFSPTFRGYLDTKSGPTSSSEQLEATRERIVRVGESGLKEPLNYTFEGDEGDQNLFARLVRGELEQWRVWEDDAHVAWLTPFPNTPGFTVLVPRRHLSSDIFRLEEIDYTAIVRAAYVVMGVLRRVFGVEKVGMFFEGFEIDYTHVKLVPVHAGREAVEAPPAPCFEVYPGYVTTQRGPSRVAVVS